MRIILPSAKRFSYRKTCFRSPIGQRLISRAEVRDSITTFPKQLITPLPGGKASGWLNDLVHMVSLSYIF